MQGARAWLCRPCRAAALTAAAAGGIPIHTPVGERVASKLHIGGAQPGDPTLGPCWTYLGHCTDENYGYMHDGPRRCLVHVWVHEKVIGPIPDGWQVDHLCHTPTVCRLGRLCPHRSCGNPAHLEAVTVQENTLRSGSSAAEAARKTVCLRGHPLTGDNVAFRPHRKCRTCCRDRNREWWRANAARSRPVAGQDVLF